MTPTELLMIFSAIAVGIHFGAWQKSYSAGAWMFMIFLIIPLIIKYAVKL